MDLSLKIKHLGFFFFLDTTLPKEKERKTRRKIPDTLLFKYKCSLSKEREKARKRMSKGHGHPQGKFHLKRTDLSEKAN